MKVFLDTEFNGFGGQLISIGMVTEDHREFYEVVGVPENPHPWVVANVVPSLNKINIGLEGVRRRFHGFIAGLPPTITVVADWPEDHIHFMRLMICQEPDKMIMKNVQALLVQPNAPALSDLPHNALEDAKALGRAFGFDV